MTTVADALDVVGVAAAALLRTEGFTPLEAARLVALRGRHQRGEFRQISIEQKRLEFARW